MQNNQYMTPANNQGWNQQYTNQQPNNQPMYTAQMPPYQLPYTTSVAQQSPNTYVPYQRYSQPQPTFPQLYGKYVQNPNEIRPNDIPMDGSTSFFPSMDGSCVYAKTWGADGTILTQKYVPEAAQPETAPVQGYSEIMEKLGAIEQLLASKKPTVYQKKEAANNG